eukprot:SAG31_NODE_970_length_10676_cov_12.566985_5_plen_100_part_00
MRGVLYPGGRDPGGAERARVAAGRPGANPLHVQLYEDSRLRLDMFFKKLSRPAGWVYCNMRVCRRYAGRGGGRGPPRGAAACSVRIYDVDKTARYDVGA